MTQPLHVVDLDAALLKIPTAAAVLGVSVSTINRLIKDGTLIAVKRGKRCTRLTSENVAAVARNWGA